MKKFLAFVLFLICFITITYADSAIQESAPSWWDKLISFDFAALFVVVSAFLSAFAGMCKYIGDMTNSGNWGVAGTWIGKIIGWLGKLVEFLNTLKPKSFK